MGRLSEGGFHPAYLQSLPELEMGWRLTVALVAGWQNKVGGGQGGDERRKWTMNNLSAVPRDLGTFVFPVI